MINVSYRRKLRKLKWLDERQRALNEKGYINALEVPEDKRGWNDIWRGNS